MRGVRQPSHHRHKVSQAPSLPHHTPGQQAVAGEGAAREEGRAIFHKHRLPRVDENGTCRLRLCSGAQSAGEGAVGAGCMGGSNCLAACPPFQGKAQALVHHWCRFFCPIPAHGSEQVQQLTRHQHHSLPPTAADTGLADHCCHAQQYSKQQLRKQMKTREASAPFRTCHQHHSLPAQQQPYQGAVLLAQLLQEGQGRLQHAHRCVSGRACKRQGGARAGGGGEAGLVQGRDAGCWWVLKAAASPRCRQTTCLAWKRW